MMDENLETKIKWLFFFYSKTEVFNERKSSEQTMKGKSKQSKEDK